MAEQALAAIEVWAWKEKGYLPGGVPWDDLPNKTIEACQFIDYLHGKKMAAAAKTPAAPPIGRVKKNGHKSQRY